MAEPLDLLFLDAFEAWRGANDISYVNISNSVSFAAFRRHLISHVVIFFSCVFVRDHV